MVALVYHPVFDPYNAIVRCLRASQIIERSFSKEEIEFYQFAILFPEIFAKTRLTAVLRSKWVSLRFSPRFEYEVRPPLDRLLKRSHPNFEAAFQTLIATAAFKPETEDRIVVDWQEVDARLIEIISRRNSEEAELMAFLASVTKEIPFEGAGGLKDRSGILEFRYDVV